MADDETSLIERRVLMLLPAPQDTEAAAGLLNSAGLACVACRDLFQMCQELRAGCGVVVLAEEALADPGIGALMVELELQPAWSDLAVVMLMHGGIQSPESARLLQLLGNITVLESPAAMRSVISAVNAAVRARQRQYQARAQIAEIQRAESRYKGLQQQLETAIDASELGTFHCEMPLGKILWNDRCKAHFWLGTDAEIDFDLFYSILHPDDREATRQAVQACVHRGTVYDMEYRTVSKRGEIRWVRATGRTYFDDGGNAIRFDGTTQDITAKRWAAEEREELLLSEQAARAESERAGRMKDEFLATLSHELRTPINAILGWSQLIRRVNDRETLEEGIEVIERNAKAQVQLIEDLLDMSRIISGKVRLEIQQIDPETFITAAMDTVMPAALARGIALVKVVDSAAGMIAGDTGRLQQVVWNLLSNAIKFTPVGGQVEVRMHRLDSQVKISVTDSGQGIKPEFLPHVFERFRQADSSTTRSHGGLGLGLAIVKQLVELHGGTISATSPGAGQGSTFTFTLPVHVSPEPANESAALGGPSRSRAFDCNPAMLAGTTVLVVDDQADARGLVKRVLEECGAKVVIASSAVDALQMVPSLRPDVLLSDIGMPGMDGYELIRRVRALGGAQGGDVPAIALTAFARSEDRTHALLAGYRIHIAKPVEPYELIATVAAVAGHSTDALKQVQNA